MTRLKEMSPLEVEILEQAGKKVIELLADEPFEIEGSAKTSVKTKEGTYKTKAMLPGLGMFMNYVYVGKRGNAIFGMAPECTQTDYEFAEFDPKQIDTFFPLAGGALARSLGLEGEDFRDVFGQIVMDLTKEKEAEKARSQNEIVDNPKFGMF